MKVRSISLAEILKRFQRIGIIRREREDLAIFLLGISNSTELGVAVVHVEDLVAQNLFENRAGCRVVIDAVAIDRESAGGGFLRNVEKGEESWIGLVLDLQVIQPVAARQRTPGE